jgi:hypothetical protein
MNTGKRERDAGAPPPVSKKLLKYIEAAYEDECPPAPPLSVLQSGAVSNYAETLLVQVCIQSGRREVIETLRALNANQK